MISDVIFLIPSYRRSERQDTLSYLRGMGYGKERIVISTQTETDYSLYSAAYGGIATVIYRPGNCVADQRNNLLDYACAKGFKKALLLDDDIRCLTILRKSGLRKDGGGSKDIFDRSEFERIIWKCFSVAEKGRAPLFGVYPVENSVFQSFKVDARHYFIGTLIGVLDMDIRFNNQFVVKEDYELCLRMISRGFNCIRFRYLALKAGHKTKGGCKELWDNGFSQKCTMLLLQMYPDLIKENPRRKGEIIMRKK